jgi:predicted RNase H-like HicB family nuclease
MNLYTAVLRKSGTYWVALCLENGVVGQGSTREAAIEKLREAIHSLLEVTDSESDVYTSTISIKELHEFLSLGIEDPPAESYELRAVNA